MHVVICYVRRLRLVVFGACSGIGQQAYFEPPSETSHVKATRSYTHQDLGNPTQVKQPNRPACFSSVSVPLSGYATVLAKISCHSDSTPRK
eukprot:scaffold673704_cov64-Prasinocladus_malaysianus.AAC.1